ncbi:long-chain-fatty-acid--CoA ligase [Paraoerskovia sediminicola]|uniref:Acyl-CoA synthetase n=1 Tax=Paraoerskovia sediminicola TaxID=1138587 RepID=A0ABN6XB43_9CELL|nr:AMP-dependent synthetase/ligase [Paraoerskovia sediminicola]BDZ42012.1 long-chain-fatty-acid--CoA ligase [Paraoerskovia sediminicola]
MRETSGPAAASLDDHRNATDLLARRVAAAPEHVAFEVRPGAADGAWRPVTTAQFYDEVVGLAKGFVAAGLAPGDAVAVMAPTRYEWALVDMAAWFAGAVVVPVYETSAPAQVSAIVADAQVRLGVGGGAEHVALLAGALAAQERTTLGVWSMDASAGADLAALVEHGASVMAEALEARRRVADLDSVATIVYTSGTTADPRGAILTHRNLVGQVLNVAAAYGDVVREDGSTIIFLPLAHVLARGLQLVCLASGMRIAHLSDPKDVVPSLAVLRPTFLVVVPRVLQKIQAAAGSAAAEKHLGPVWAAAQRAAVEQGRGAERGDAPSWSLRLRHRVFDALFYRRLRALMGGRIGFLLSGAASLDAELALFFRGIGVPVLEGYGLTETTAPLTGNLPQDMRAGSVGVPLPGTTVRISDDGEVLARGTGVFVGYRDADATAQAFVDGFFRTGDLGSLDDAGHLTLSGRLKDVVTTSGGKTVAPATWELSVENHPLVAHAMLVGENKPYLGGVVVLDPEAVAARDADGAAALPAVPAPDGVPVEVDDVRVRSVVEAAVEAANAQVARSEQVRRFAVVLADLTVAGGLVTPTMKLKRAELAARAQAIIENLYAESRAGS